MHEHNFWDDYAEALELTVEGNQQIAREIGQYIKNWWNAAHRAIAKELSEFDDHRKLPPV